MGRRGTWEGGWERREGLRCQAEQLHFEVRPVLLGPSEPVGTPGAQCVRHATCSGGAGGAALVRLKGQGQLFGAAGAQASWTSSGMRLPRQKGNTQGRGVKRRETGLGDTGQEGLAQAADPQRRRVSPQSREELSSGSGCQCSCPRSSSSEPSFAPQVSTPPQPQDQGSWPGSQPASESGPSASWTRAH